MNTIQTLQALIREQAENLELVRSQAAEHVDAYAAIKARYVVLQAQQSDALDTLDAVEIKCEVLAASTRANAYSKEYVDDLEYDLSQLIKCVLHMTNKKANMVETDLRRVAEITAQRSNVAKTKLDRARFDTIGEAHRSHFPSTRRLQVTT